MRSKNEVLCAAAGRLAAERSEADKPAKAHKTIFALSNIYSRNVVDMDWGLVVKLALPAKVTRRANKVIGIYDRSH
jgi:hypothetical protein